MSNYYTMFKKFLRKYFDITVKEWHALAFGGISGFLMPMGAFATTIAFLITSGKQKGHLSDIRQEVGYTVGAYAVIYGLLNGVNGL